MVDLTIADKEIEISIHADIAPKLNFACHQASFPLLRALSVENLNEDKRVEDLTVTLSSDPPFVKTRTWKIDRLAENGRVQVRGRDLELDGGFLLYLADAMKGTVTITVEIRDEIVTENSYPVELLAYNEWGGAGYMPELLAAFSMPNDPAIDKILNDASKLLRSARRPDAIDGYQSGKRERVWELASSIYGAIANLGLTYAMPPASFENDGQKIRLPSQILKGRVATCLDTTMLFASALEQAHLNPIVVMPKDHAMVGVWLQPEELTTIVIDDAETLRKRIQLKELILIETTNVTSHPAAPFNRAIKNADEHVLQELDESFNSAVDIKRARAHRITPLALKVERAQIPGEPDLEPTVITPIDLPPPLPDFDVDVEEESPDTPQTRLERWQRKLLDLSARNPLLAHKSTKTSLQIICPNPGQLEDKLAEGARISIQAVPTPTSQAQDEDIHRQRTGESISEEYARDALQKNQVLVNLPPEELSKRSVDIYRKAQTALQE
ncbi:MAG: DUF4011 domain-containing protein, partial [Rhodospirillaceae bacterium]|nr:DUF4011 domain-containing protein [Rhodospirillaceae bacterium]